MRAGRPSAAGRQLRQLVEGQLQLRQHAGVGGGWVDAGRLADRWDRSAAAGTRTYKQKYILPKKGRILLIF